MFDLLMNAAINGLLLGGVLALLAFGMNLIFGVVKIIHMAYGQCVMLGLYFIYTLVTHLGLPILLACLLTLPLMGVIGIGLQMFVINPLLRAKANPLTQLLALAGLTIVIENLAQVIWGADLRGINVQLPLISFGNVFLRTSNLIAFFGALLTLWGLYLFLNRTYLGLAIRSIAQDVDSSRLMGINPQAIYYVTMAAGGVLTGLIAAFFSPIYAVHPHFGGQFHDDGLHYRGPGRNGQSVGWIHRRFRHRAGHFLVRRSDLDRNRRHHRAGYLHRRYPDPAARPFGYSGSEIGGIFCAPRPF